MRFNTTGGCKLPLVATTDRASWYGEVEGCGVQCQNPLFSDEEHKQMHTVVFASAIVCFLCTLFTVVSQQG
jgi:smoothened protein